MEPISGCCLASTTRVREVPSASGRGQSAAKAGVAAAASPINMATCVTRTPTFASLAIEHRPHSNSVQTITGGFMNAALIVGVIHVFRLVRHQRQAWTQLQEPHARPNGCCHADNAGKRATRRPFPPPDHA